MTTMATKVSDHFDNLMDKCFFNGARPGFVEDSGNRSLAAIIRPFIRHYKDDKDYRAIIRFQDDIELLEYRKHKLAVEELGKLMGKFPQSTEFKAARLKEMGLEKMDICGALQKSTSWFDNHVRRQVDKSIDQGYDLEGAIFDIKNRLEDDK